MNVSREEIETIFWRQTAEINALSHSITAVQSALVDLLAKVDGADVIALSKQIESDAANRYQLQIEAMKKNPIFPEPAIREAEAVLDGMKKRWAWND